MRNDFVNFVDAHRISAVPSHAILAQAQVVIAQSNVRPKREFFLSIELYRFTIYDLQGADPMNNIASQAVSSRQNIFVTYQAASTVNRNLAGRCGTEKFSSNRIVFT